MSNVPAIPAITDTPVAHPYEDTQYRQALRRLELEAAVIARMPGLKKSIQGKTPDDAKANVMAIGLTLLSFGVRPNVVNVNAFHMIEGQAVPSTQFYCGLAAAACGHEVWVDDDSDSERAIAFLRRADTGRVHKVVYTVEDARKSKALDFWVEKWFQEGGKKKAFLGEDEAAAEAAKPAWAKNENLKSNPAWHHHRADMLAIRAARRALKRGAPEVAAGLASFEAASLRTIEHLNVTTADLSGGDDETEGEVWPDASVVVDPEDEAAMRAEEGRENDALRPPSAPPEVRKQMGEAIQALPQEARRELAKHWEAASLPPLGHPDFDTTDALDAALMILGVRSAPAIDDRGGEQSPLTAGSGGKSQDQATASERASSPGDATPDAPTPSDRARPLAQRIAMSAQAAGVDHHHVIAAVTAGEKTSAREVDVEEGQLTLQAIAAIKAGKYTVVERDGQWVFEDPPDVTAEMFDQGQPFT